MSNNNVIELNGNTYDALTGKVISAGGSSGAKIAPIRPTPKPGVHASGIKAQHVSKMHQKTVKSSTLMRSAVKKPVINPIRNVTAHKARPKHMDVPKSSKVTAPAIIGSIDPHRIARANHVPKSTHVSRFGRTSSKNVMLAEVPVQNAPRIRATPHHIHQQAKRAATPKTTNPFEHALKTATSHELPRLRRTRLHHRIAKKLHIAPRTLLISTGALSVLVIGGFLAYTRIPSVAMKVASTKAGMDATLPAYQPAGFSLRGPIATSPGEISLSYKSNSDQRDFKLTQKASAWNSEALLSNFVETAKQASYQTFQSAGRTIYIYDGSNATWVDGGIWYKIEGNSSLNSDQLLRIANSL